VTTELPRRRAELRHGLAVLYRELKDELLTVAVHLAGARDSGEDLLHDVFVAFARRGVAIDEREEARRYLVTSLVNRARDLARCRAPPASDEAALAGAAADGDPMRHVAANEEAQRVTASLLALPAEQREVVTLHLHGGLAFREIAAALSIPINTATSRYRYALLALKRQLAPRGVSE
jgi:RNA polymerase sigma-70 factor (ECF subfamily)